MDKISGAVNGLDADFSNLKDAIDDIRDKIQYIQAEFFYLYMELDKDKLEEDER